MDDQTLGSPDMVQGSPENQMSPDAAEPAFGPRKMSFFTLVLKTMAGFMGGIAGTLILLIIFLLTSSILQPVLSPAEAVTSEVSPLFIFVLMAMIFATSVVSSLVAPLLLCYTERDRYTRVSTALSQIFIINIVIFVFVLPIYLTTSTARLELTAYAAGLQVILSATASALILELIHDYRYSLLTVYSTILGVLVATAINFFLYTLSGSGGATVLLFASLPIIWTTIGFSQGALTMFYYWLYQNYGIDFLAETTNLGADYGIPDESEEEQPEVEKPDVEGGNFLKQ
jgi:MFS family permease